MLKSTDYSQKLLLITTLILCTLSLCAQSAPKITERLVKTGMHTTYQNRKIDVVIIHSVYNAGAGDKYDLEKVLQQFARYHVSAHYIISREGEIYQLVKEKNISYHAGKSTLPDGRTWINSCSIGIEIITTNDSTDSPTQKQIKSLVSLVRDIKSRYKIKYVLRHSDIATGRKTDPWNMNWEDFLKKI